MLAWRQLNNCTGAATYRKTPFDGRDSLYCVNEGSCSEQDSLVRCTWDGAHAYPPLMDTDSNPHTGAFLWWFLSRHTKGNRVGGE
jgi:hypothetical protein